VGAFGNIGGKGTSELMRAAGHQFSHWFTWFFVAFTAATLIIQNHFLQGALARYDQGLNCYSRFVASI
jgi:hypothetical protein